MTTTFLDDPIRLSELCEAELLTELCTGFADMHEIGIRILDTEHRPLADVQRGTSLLTWLFNFPEARKALTSFVSELKAVELDVGDCIIRETPIGGLRFLLLPITYEFDVLGKLICGPFLGAQVPPPPEDPPWSTDKDAQRFLLLQGQVPRKPDIMVKGSMKLLLTTLEAVTHAGYKSFLTSKMHLESITHAFNDLKSVHSELSKAHTELSKRADSLSEHNEHLEELDELKSNFLATVSHELRTPLTSVIGYSEMLLEGLAGPLNPEQADYVRTISERGSSLLGLISSILDISKIERGAQQLTCESVDPLALLEAALKSVRPQAKQGRLTIQVARASDLPSLQVDRYKVTQVLTNLLSNAVKFTPEGGTITARVRNATLPGRPEEDTEAVLFQIKDTGIGIPAAEQTAIFEAFYQVDNSSTRAYDGTGLGLSIVKNFVEVHGGRVHLESEPGKGSTFTVVLPTQARSTYQ